jgi:uncharacterized membrane-anchored protein YhcB (DUF1043 family)
MKKSGFPTVIYLLLVFASGILVGGFAHRLYMLNTVNASRTAREYREKYLGEMRGRLKLDGRQFAELETIMDETRQRYRDMHERLRPEIKQLQDEQTTKINSILSPEQQVEYEKYREERDRRRRANAPF